MSDTAGIFAGIVFAVVCIVPLKELKSEYASLAATALSILLTVIAIKNASPLISYIKTLSNGTSEKYYNILFKSFALAMMTHIISEMCVDFGIPSVSGKVEFIGKILIITNTVPMIETLLSLVEGML